MIIEQIRYYFLQDQRDEILRARREVTRIRRTVGIPPGHILVADPAPEEGPTLVWQCGYTDESELGTADARLIGNEEYEAARERLNTLVTRVELELYMTDEEDGS